MASFIIEGGHLLQGTITPQGAKNEALQVICASLLTEEEVIINSPSFRLPQRRAHRPTAVLLVLLLRS